jgi:hypothetical protein
MTKLQKGGCGCGVQMHGGSWKTTSPKNSIERKRMIDKCGQKCFLLPNQLKFPICNDDCSYSCSGLVAAKVRAGQYKYDDVYRKADELLKLLKCTKKYRK